MENKTNAITAKIVDYRFIGKMQLNADDMGGVGCDNWNQYLNVCNTLSVAAWNHTIGREVNADIVNAAIAGLLDFFGISVVDSKKYTARILSVLVNRKAQRSQALKDACKEKREAKKAWEDAVTAEMDEAIIAERKEAYEAISETVDALYLEPNNYWFDPAPGFDAKTKKAKPATRKALEDTCADIFTERQFMSADELQAEKVALADERKGRKMRKKAEAKAEAENA
jgi:hypothetical protein